MTLFDATRDLHHACEAHPLGQAMAGGSITPVQWAGWLWAMRCLHSVADAAVPAHMERDALFGADLMVLPRAPASRAALAFAQRLTGKDCTGTAYVLHGAHRSGGAGDVRDSAEIGVGLFASDEFRISSPLSGLDIDVIVNVAGFPDGV